MIKQTQLKSKINNAFVNKDGNNSKNLHIENVIEKEEGHIMNHGEFGYIKVVSQISTLGATFIMILTQIMTHLELEKLISFKIGLCFLIISSLFVSIKDLFVIKSLKDLAEHERKRELWECNNYLEGEKKEMIDLYTAKGMEGKEAEKVVDLMSKYQDLFVDVMMVEEIGIFPPPKSHKPIIIHSLITGASYFFAGLFPLLAFFYFHNSASYLVFSAVLFFFGRVFSKTSVYPVWACQLSFLVLGFFCVFFNHLLLSYIF